MGWMSSFFPFVAYTFCTNFCCDSIRPPNCCSQQDARRRNRMSTAKATRLLIADDDPDLLAAYALFFDAYGYDVRIVGDGVDALAEYRMWRPDAVLLDIQMPRLDGRAAARQIRSVRASPAPM